MLKICQSSFIDWFSDFLLDSKCIFFHFLFTGLLSRSVFFDPESQSRISYCRVALLWTLNFLNSTSFFMFTKLLMEYESVQKWLFSPFLLLNHHRANIYLFHFSCKPALSPPLNHIRLIYTFFCLFIELLWKHRKSITTLWDLPPFIFEESIKPTDLKEQWPNWIFWLINQLSILTFHAVEKHAGSFYFPSSHFVFPSINSMSTIYQFISWTWPSPTPATPVPAPSPQGTKGSSTQWETSSMLSEASWCGSRLQKSILWFQCFKFKFGKLFIISIMTWDKTGHRNRRDYIISLWDIPISRISNRPLNFL